MQSVRPAEESSWTGGTVSGRAWCQVCPHPSPMTLEGTNTWVLAEPGSSEAVVVDPGPLQERHLDAVRTRVTGHGLRVSLILLTHHHDDHAESAERCAEMTGAPIRGFGRGHADLTDGDRLDVGGLEIVVVATPGHTADSLSFLLPAEQRLLTGDTVLGRGSTVVAHPDGELAAYLESLHRLEKLTRSGQVTSLAPGHGPARDDAAAVVESYLLHRRQRLRQVERALEEIDVRPEGIGPEDLADVMVARLYSDVPQGLRSAARLSVLAQLRYLRRV